MRAAGIHTLCAQRYINIYLGLSTLKRFNIWSLIERSFFGY